MDVKELSELFTFVMIYIFSYIYKMIFIIDPFVANLWLSIS